MHNPRINFKVRFHSVPKYKRKPEDQFQNKPRTTTIGTNTPNKVTMDYCDACCIH